MRRILGTTGAPQAIPRITDGQAPLLDLTSAQSQRSLQDRTLYVDLWAYLPYTASGSIATAFPQFAGMLGESPVFSGEACVLLGETNDLPDAIAGDHRILAEAKWFEGPLSGNLVSDPSETALAQNAPTHILKRHPINGPVALWFLHNYATAGAVLPFVWGYYTIEGEDIDLLSRVLQPDAEEPVLEYIPPTILSPAAGNPNVVTIHQNLDDLIDELTLEVAVTGNNFQQAATADTMQLAHSLRFTGAGVTMPIWAGGDWILTTAGYENIRCRHKAYFRTWFDGIPMRGVGDIQLLRPASATRVLRSTARGSFVRY